MFEEPHRKMRSAVTTVVGGIEAGGDGSYRHGLAALAVGLIMLSAGASPAAAASLHRLASGTIAFSSDGTRFVAWQNRGDEQIVVFDTLTGRRRSITPPAGCRLHNEVESGEPVISAAAGRFLLECEEGACTGAARRADGQDHPAAEKDQRDF